MRVEELIIVLDNKIHQPDPTGKNLFFVDYLELLKKIQNENPGQLVMVSNGECEREGVYAPVQDDGALDLVKARPFREGEPLPDGDWIQVGFFNQRHPTK